MNAFRLPPRSRGFALVQAIFLLVVLALLGVGMLTMSSVQSRTMLMALQGAQAYHAARSGIEWAIGAGSCVGDVLAIDGCTVTVTCVPDGEVCRVWVTAEAGSYGTPGYVQRTIEAKFR